MTTKQTNKITTSEQKNLLKEGQYKITIGAKTTTGKNVFDCVKTSFKGLKRIAEFSVPAFGLSA